MYPSSSEIRKYHQEAIAKIRKDSLNPYNRLHSIYEDSAFVQKVHDAYPGFPLVPNLRCGAWYTRPDIVSEHEAYFKSADGHYNNWTFNLRRPNLHLLPLIHQHHGIVLVDSTRSGKRIPDALSKTVPIWCAVVNRAIRQRALRKKNPEDSTAWRVAETNEGLSDRELYTPPQCVSPQEHAQIESQVDRWAQNLCDSSYSLPELDKPLRPIWVTPSTNVFPFSNTKDRISNREGASFYPIICVSASRVVEDGLERRAGGYAYVQGSGDDHESWSLGLSPSLFWKNHTILLDCDEDGITKTIHTIVSKSRKEAHESANTLDTEDVLRISIPIAQTNGRLFVAERPSKFVEQPSGYTENKVDVAFLIVSTSIDQVTPETQSTSGVPRREDDVDSSQNIGREHPPNKFYINIPQEKNNTQTSHFTSALAPSLEFIGKHVTNNTPVCIVTDVEGRDGAIGVLVAALQRWFDEEGSIRLGGGAEAGHFVVSKETIRARLQWIIASYPAANPSRATLKRVNEYFMSERRFWDSRGSKRVFNPS